MRGVVKLESAAEVFAGRESGVTPEDRTAIDVACCGAVEVDTTEDWLMFAVASVANVLRILESCSLVAFETTGFLLSGTESKFKTIERKNRYKEFSVHQLLDLDVSNV